MEKKEYIERGAALLAITGQPSELHYPSWYKGNIMEVPAADVSPVVHAEWIMPMNGNATCSHCRIRSKAVYDDDNEQHYCGYCGAKMDGGTNDR